MPKERLIKSIEVTALVHATEDESKVRKALINLLPRNVEIPTIQSTKLDGYYGDPITTFKFVIKNKKPASEIFDFLISELSSIDLDTLLRELPKRMDETKNLYIRIDKQKAYQGRIILQRHDALRLKIKLQLPYKADPVTMMHKYIENITSE
jgi:RNA binding exosome subunit